MPDGDFFVFLRIKKDRDMLALDILILAVLAVGGAIGFSRGLLSQVGQIAAVAVGIILCRLFGSEASALLSGGNTGSAFDYVAGYAVVFLGGYGITWLVARMLRKTVHAIHLGILDRLGGALFKIGLWGLMLSLALNVMLLITGDDNEIRRPDKPWRAAVTDYAPAVLGYLSRVDNINHGDSVKK